MDTATHPTATMFPVDRIAACIGQCADSNVQSALFDYLDRRCAQLGKDFDPDAVIRDEVNPALKPYGMEIIVTAHDDGGVTNYSYSLWFPPFVRPVWGDIDMDEVRAKHAEAAPVPKPADASSFLDYRLVWGDVDEIRIVRAADDSPDVCVHHRHPDSGDLPLDEVIFWLLERHLGKKEN